MFGLYLLWRTGEWALDKFVYENSEFAIQHVDVQTDGVIAPDQLRRWSGVKLGDNLIALDLAAVKRNLELVSTIGSVSVERILPRTLQIRVTEREPVAQVNVPRAGASGGIAVAVFQLDADGYVMQPLDPRLCVIPLAQVSDQLPVIAGLECVSIAAGPSRRIAAGAGGAGIDRARSTIRRWPGWWICGALMFPRRESWSRRRGRAAKLLSVWTIWSNNCGAGAKFTIWDSA